MAENSNIKDYLLALEQAFGDADRALIVDALDDADEHLNEMMAELMAEGLSEKKALKTVISSYGSPKTIAKEYIKQDKIEMRERIEKHPHRYASYYDYAYSDADHSTKKKESIYTKPKKKKEPKRSMLENMFGVYLRPRTYLNLLYLFLLFPLGIVYFCYIVTMVSVSLSLVITVIGIPIGIGFLVTIFLLGWFQGRLTELMTGVRFPRKKRKFRAKGGPWKRVKTLLKDPRLYSTLFYLFLLFPIGIAAFVIEVTLIATALSLIAAPILYMVWLAYDVPIHVPAPIWFQFLLSAFGFILLTWSLHLLNGFAWINGKIAKVMLLRTS